MSSATCTVESAEPVAPVPQTEPTPTTQPPIVPSQVVTAPPGDGPPPGQPSQVELEEDEKRRRYGAVWPPPGYVEPACELDLSTKAVRRGVTHDVTAFARNKSTKPIRLALPSRCPQGPVVFSGLPEGYDYYQSCAITFAVPFAGKTCFGAAARVPVP